MHWHRNPSALASSDGMMRIDNLPIAIPVFYHRGREAMIIEELLESLAKLESVSTERSFIEINLARVFVAFVLGTTWHDKFLALGTNPDPWMLNANDAWLAEHPVAVPDLRRITYSYRMVRLSDALFTVLDKVDGFELLRQRFLKRRDPRAPFTEAEIAGLLAHNGCGVRIIGESGVRGTDFDMLATVRGVDVSVEVTEVIGTELKVSSLLNKLNGKRNQVPANRPAVLYVLVPDQWMKNQTLAFLVINQAITRFMRGSRRFNAVIFVWEEIRPAPGGGVLQRFLQPVFNNKPRWPIKDLAAFGMKKDKWGSRRYTNSLLDALRTFRLKQQIEGEWHGLR
jgi:hypothetical protein